MLLNIDQVIENKTEPGLHDPCEEFVEATKVHRDLMGIELPNISKMNAMQDVIRASFYSTKSYTSVHEVKLPTIESKFLDDKTLSDVLWKRESVSRIEPGESLMIDDLGRLLWCADGVSHELQPGQQGRTTPSGGALYPRDIYCITSEKIQLSDYLVQRGTTIHIHMFWSKSAMHPLRMSSTINGMLRQLKMLRFVL